MMPRESWWIDLVTAEVKVSEVGPKWANVPCNPRERKKVVTGIIMRTGRKMRRRRAKIIKIARLRA